MPDAVETLSYAKFSQRDIPWWGTGTSAREKAVEGRWLTAEEAKATWPWHMELRPAYQRRANGGYRAVPDQFHVTLIHDDPFHDDHEMVLGAVGKLYAPVQPYEVVDQAQELVDDYDFGFDTAGDLKRHRIVFCCLKISQMEGLLMSGVSSELDFWLVITNFNDGTGAYRGDIVPIRPVCFNTLQMALNNSHASWRLRHVGDMQGRGKEGRRALGIITKYEREFQETAERLAEVPFEIEQYQNLIEELMPTDETVGPRSRVFHTDHQTGMMANFLTSQTIPDEWRFTKWGALNAITEWSEWIYSERKDPRTGDRDRHMVYKMYDGPQQRFRQTAFEAVVRA